MLYEIICDKFKEEKIIFNPGLNTILGDDIGSNSIGKSTFLMIIDFVFGGKDYIDKLRDVHNNIDYHVIKFCFTFNKTNYYFLRKTVSPEYVWKCDSNYNAKEEISLDIFCSVLKKLYEINIQDISFRDIVGRYSRVYGKDNLNEKKPLNIVPNETAGAPINSLIKLFQLFEKIKNSENDLKEKKSEFKAFKNAQKYNFISSIKKRKYNHNLKEKTRITNEINEFTNDFENGLLDYNSIQTEQLLDLKQKLSYFRRKRTILKSDLEALENNTTRNVKIKNKYDELIQFFPNVNLNKLNQIDEFHSTINNALNSEIKNKKIKISELIKLADSEIIKLENEIKEVAIKPNISTVVLRKYSNLRKELDQIENENISFDNHQTLKKSENESKYERNKMRSDTLKTIEKSLNKKLDSINNFIYDGDKKPPIITFDNNNYTFQTYDDNGTGNNHKSLIIFDISIMEMTQLPILIHDSVLLKQIEDNAIEKLLKKYISEEKQTFISLDKKTAYTEESQRLLLENKVLELGPNENALFGRVWNKK